MKIGACGIACEVCRNYVQNECSGCEAGTSEAAPVFVEILKGIGFSCSVLECAIENGVGYCLKDCDKFPCEVHSRGFPYSQRFLDVFRT